MQRLFAILVLATVSLASTSLFAQVIDTYEDYIRTSDDFRRVKQEKAWASQAFPSWTFMPWTHQWGIGYNDDSGRWSVEHGYNGAFIDRDGVGTKGSKTGRIDWIEKFKLRFYVDHAAGKGLLHLWDGDKVKPHLDALHGVGVRPIPLNAATKRQLEELLQKNIGAVKASSQRAAYALDDEPSWGHFVHPTMWQITDDPKEYPRWLSAVYGASAVPKREHWVSYEDIRTKLAKWSVAEFDASPLMDQWSFNDSHWCNFVGQLVEHANAIDPATPCGLVGGQMPSPFGGYDYAKLMRKVQFIESYNLGSSQAIIRSFNPENALPSVTTLFHKSVEDTIWQTWYYLAHGNRGHIGWVEGWFDGSTPKPWHEQVAPALLEAGNKIGPLMKDAKWKHDGIAIYYSQPSIQLGWILDAEAHGKTWINRNADERLSSAAHVRRAWENMLRDSGLQYNFVSYVDVIERGVPDEYRVLILPACLALSDAEARAIRSFCERGGTVIADYLPGLWDQHGRGRESGGALDDLFAVKHDPSMHASDLFGEKLWTEIDQDANYSWKTYDEFLTNKNSCLQDGSGFHKAVRTMPVDHVVNVGRGYAVLMNLSPQWYNAYRVAGFEAAKKRDVFMRHILSADSSPWVRIVEAGESEHGYEIVYWTLPTGRILLFVCLNPEIRGTSLGGGNSVGLKAETLSIKLRFSHEVKDVRDERTGRVLQNATEFSFDWKQTEAVVLSFSDAQFE
ncbi:MAG: beta-galactosidase trimerization domain-containing protein [Pirellulaceae bacterium]|nr:beta-galactosidase trimerization domain-containing protein [Pirellulaceae bacterium]